MPEPVDILGLSSDAFIDRAGTHDVARPVALEIYRALFRRNAPGPDWIGLPDAPITRREPLDDAIKFAQATGDGRESETVILPYRGRSGRERTTLCVSSQIGCAMGCTFCETGQMGLMGNLTAAQMIAQWRAARFECASTIDNVVFMGMGEPMDNFDEVAAAIRVFTDANGPAIAPSRITVSTVGRIAGIERMSELMAEPGLGRLRLAVSVNAPNDEIRNAIMPVNRAEPMSALRVAMQAWTERHRGRVLIEYVLIPGVNDADAHADELAGYVESLPCTINVIPYNPRRDSPWPAPREASVDRFMARLAGSGPLVTRRQTRGRDTMAACGQLGSERVRRRRFVSMGDAGPGTG